MQCGERKPKQPAMEMIPITSTTSTDIQIRIQKALEEEGINPRGYEKYLLRK